MKPTELYASVDLFPADYLARNQTEPERVLKVRQAADGRRKARNERKRKWAERAGVLRPTFHIDLRKENNGTGDV